LLRLPLGLRLLVGGDHRVGALVAVRPADQHEELGQDSVDGGLLVAGAGTGNAVRLVGRDGLLGGVVAVQQQGVDLVLEQAQVGGVACVVAQVPFVVVHRAFAFEVRAATCSRSSSCHPCCQARASSRDSGVIP